MQYITLALSAAAVILLIILLVRRSSVKPYEDLGKQFRRDLTHELADSKREIAESVKDLGDANLDALDRMAHLQSESQKQLQLGLSAQLAQFGQSTSGTMQQMEQRLRSLEDSNEKKLEAMRVSMADSMKAMSEENSRRLEEIRGTVDEKLQTTLEKRITESFRRVSEQLEQVYKGLGEMQTLASDVGGLKKVLSGVKTRGILGEVQLGAILEEILTPEQYDTNVATIPGSSERVEYAVRMPGSDGSTVWLPIDSKFPGDTYAHLTEARENGDRAEVENAFKQLEIVMKKEASDIRSKYVEVPYTTDFGILFLPFEGLYAEAVNSGLMETLRRDYRVNIAGPSTMAALLNSLQMGFRTLAIQKRSGEVWEVLGAVKTEFDKFDEAMTAMQKHLNQTSADLESLMGKRSRAIRRKLRTVQELDEDKASQVLQLEEDF